jgi:hypothetical protein
VLLLLLLLLLLLQFTASSSRYDFIYTTRVNDTACQAETPSTDSSKYLLGRFAALDRGSGRDSGKTDVCLDAEPLGGYIVEEHSTHQVLSTPIVGSASALAGMVVVLHNSSSAPSIRMLL